LAAGGLACAQPWWLNRAKPEMASNLKTDFIGSISFLDPRWYIRHTHPATKITAAGTGTGFLTVRAA
jgi:hypothetical protein